MRYTKKAAAPPVARAAKNTNARMIVVEGTLYPLLTRLKNSGLVEYKWVESKSGPPRKYYKLTDMGNSFLSGLTEYWQVIFGPILVAVVVFGRGGLVGLLGVMRRGGRD